MTDAIKVQVYKQWKEEGRSKASLAVEHEVSPRTISRWLEAAEEHLANQPVEAVKEVESSQPKKVEDTRYLEAAVMAFKDGDATSEISEHFSVSESTIRRWLKKAAAELDQPTQDQTTEPLVEYKYNASAKSIAITQISNNKTTGQVAVDRSADSFDQILDTLIANSFSQDSLAEAFIQLQPMKALDKFTHGKLTIDAKNREIFYVADEDTIPYKVNNKLTTRVIAMVRDGETGVTTLLNFMEKLMENPSRRAVEELYGFLEANDIKIVESGDFIAWKKVRSDYLDIHSGTIDNSPGKSPRVARNMVDEDSNRTCSYGLHVCSKSYLPNFGNGGSRVVSVLVNPADVVAIPADYNNAKMRCAGYTVLDEVTSQFLSQQ